jgi:acyl transferase domain-containing protein
MILPTQWTAARKLDWPAAGVSSFGFSGTIAHSMLCAAPTQSMAFHLAPVPLQLRRASFSWGTPSIRHPGARVLQQAVPIPFLGTLSSSSSAGIVFEQTFSPSELRFLQGHRVGGVPLLPGTCYIEMARAMVRQQHSGATAFALMEIRFEAILFLDEANLRGPPTLWLRWHRGSGQLAVASRDGKDGWDTHATMVVQLSQSSEGEGGQAVTFDAEAVQARCPLHLIGDTFYAECDACAAGSAERERGGRTGGVHGCRDRVIYGERIALAAAQQQQLWRRPIDGSAVAARSPSSHPLHTHAWGAQSLAL